MDLDDEELKATRMMNGADRNSRVNMEQDINENIKILERMLKIEKECLHYDVSQDEIRALEHLIKAYKELEEENTELKECLEVTSKALDNVAYDQIPIAIEDLTIPKSLVEEKIEEFNKLITEAQKELGSASKEYTI